MDDPAPDHPVPDHPVPERPLDGAPDGARDGATDDASGEASDRAPDHAAGDGGADEARADLGAGIVNLDFLGTGLLVGTSAGGALLPASFGAVHAVVSIAAFTIGVAAFLWAYALGVGRSRTDLIGIGGLFFLAGGAAPSVVAFRFRAALVVQIVAVVAAASIRPFSVVAFGILAPMLGLGLMGLWGGRHGAFPPRPPDDQ